MVAAVLKLVPKHTVVTDPARPYRLWNANDKRPERWRCYTSVDNAHNGATLQLRWAPIGAHLEVYDVRTWRHLGTYSKVIAKEGFDIRFSKGNGHVIVKAHER